MLPKDNVAQCARGRTPHFTKQPSDAAVRLKALGGKNMSLPRPEENGCVISVHHCQSQSPAQLADPSVLEARARDGRIGRCWEAARDVWREGGLK